MGNDGQQWETIDNSGQQWTTIRGATGISDAVFDKLMKPNVKVGFTPQRAVTR